MLLNKSNPHRHEHGDILLEFFKIIGLIGLLWDVQGQWGLDGL